MRLAKAGYGSINDMETIRADKFINLIHYENFLSEYQNALNDLNKKG